MKQQLEDIQATYIEGLKSYIRSGEESNLAKAYEQSFELLSDGMNEVRMIELHHEVLVEVCEEEPAVHDKLERASEYLQKWMAPFKVKLQSFRALIDELHDRNLQLQTEIQNRKEIEQELNESKEYFQSLIENGQDIITVIDKDGTVRYNSPSVVRILEYEKDELIGSKIFKYIHSDDLEKVKDLFRNLISEPGGVASAEFRFLHKKGTWVYLESIAKHVSDSRDGPMIVVNSRDISGRKFTLSKLRDHKTKLAEAQAIAKVGSWEWHPNEAELEWSDEMCRIYGFNPTNFDHSFKTFIDHVHPNDRSRVEKTVELALKHRSSFSFEHRITRTDGQLRTLFCRGRVMVDDSGEVVKVMGIGQDITDQKEKEKKLQKYSERLRKLSERVARSREEERIRIARELHDELGQMLTVLKMDVSMLSGKMKKKVAGNTLDYFNEQASQILERINTIIKSVQRITTELRPEVLDDLGLIEALKWQAREIEKRTKLDIQFMSTVTNSDFLDDDLTTTIFRVFQEAMNNIVRHAEATEVNIDLDKKNGHLVLSIMDNGVGIDESEKEATSSVGIIGMRERTRFLGGDLFVEGKKGEGTNLIMWVPFSNKKT